MCERWRQKGGLALCPCTQAGGSWSSGRRTTRRESGALASGERAVQDAEGPLGSSPPPPAPPPLPSPRPASSGSATPPRAAAPGRGREGGASGGRGSSTLTAPGGGAELPARPGRAPRREQTRDRELRREGPGGRERGRTRCPRAPPPGGPPSPGLGEGARSLAPRSGPSSPHPPRAPCSLPPAPHPARRPGASSRFRLSFAQPRVRPTGSSRKRAGVCARPLRGSGGHSWKEPEGESGAGGRATAGGPGTILWHLGVTDARARSGAGSMFEE